MEMRGGSRLHEEGGLFVLIYYSGVPGNYGELVDKTVVGLSVMTVFGRFSVEDKFWGLLKQRRSKDASSIPQDRRVHRDR